MDLLISQETNDVIFINGECPVTRDNIETIAQKLKIKLSTFAGEWFLDTTVGVPYFQSIFGKIRSKDAIDLIFQEQINGEPLVIEIVTFESSITDRNYSLTFTVRTAPNGEVTEEIVISI